MTETITRRPTYLQALAEATALKNENKRLHERIAWLAGRNNQLAAEVEDQQTQIKDLTDERDGIRAYVVG